MRIPTLDPQLSLQTTRREVRYTLLRLRRRPWAKSWVPVFEGLLKETDAAIASESQLNDTLEDAEVGIDEADDTLDGAVEGVNNSAKSTLKGDALELLADALFSGRKPSEFVRTKLGPQLAGMRAWPAVLLAAAPQALKDWAPQVEAAIAEADAAVTALTQADAAMQAFRTGVHVPLVKKIDGQRQALGGEAKNQARTSNGDADESGLFRISARQRRRAAQPETLEQARAEVASRRAELEQAETRLAALEAQAQAEEQAEAKRQADRQKLETLLKQRSEADKEIAALRAGLLVPAK